MIKKQNCFPVPLLFMLYASNTECKIIFCSHFILWSTSKQRLFVRCHYLCLLGSFVKTKQLAINKTFIATKLCTYVSIFMCHNSQFTCIEFIFSFIQILPKSRGWAVPAYAGVCGRLEVVADEGVPLSDLGNIAWYRKLKIAKQILEMAMDFTFKHDR